MIQKLAIASFIALAATATVSVADDYRNAGTRGTVTAYELDGRTVISHRFCTSRGRSTYDYIRCSDSLRDSVKIRLCSRLGSGTHHYLYQLGDGRPTRSSVFCPSRRY